MTEAAHARKATGFLRNIWNDIAGISVSAFSFISFRSGSNGGDGDGGEPPAKAKTPKETKPPPGRINAPVKLKLEFSKAADRPRIDQMFDPAVKSKVDPQGQVVKRDAAVLESAILRGGCAFLSDEKNGDVQNMAIAYHVGKPDQNGRHDYTEVGTTLSRMGGYNGAHVVIAALALREWWNNPPKHMIVTEIMPDNKASLKTYNHYLGWRPVTSKLLTTILSRLCNDTIAPEDQSDKALWFHCDDTVITHQARLLLSFMDQGGLVHKQSHRRVSVDFSALEQEGLTRARLEALAFGMTDRKKLQALAP